MFYKKALILFIATIFSHATHTSDTPYLQAAENTEQLKLKQTRNRLRTSMRTQGPTKKFCWANDIEGTIADPKVIEQLKKEAELKNALQHIIDNKPKNRGASPADNNLPLHDPEQTARQMERLELEERK